MIDKSGLFKDFNFKLVVINSLLEKDASFQNKLTNFEKYIENFEWYSGNGPIQQLINFFEDLVLTKEDLNKVEELFFDGGEEIYFLLKPDWDGQDAIFDITSVEGFENLPNLKNIDYISMCDEKVLEPFKNTGIIIS